MQKSDLPAKLTETLWLYRQINVQTVNMQMSTTVADNESPPPFETGKVKVNTGTVTNFMTISSILEKEGYS